MQTLLVAAMYVLGFVGLFGLTLLPLRCWYWLRHRGLLSPWPASVPARLINIVLFITISAGFCTWFWSIYKTMICLTQAVCGAARAAGWVQLVIFGLAYLSLEIIVFIGLRLAGRGGRAS
jgi:hypothetical protein